MSDGDCRPRRSRFWNEGNCCKEHTAEFLQRVHEWLPTDGRRVVVLWDNAPWHTAGLVQRAGADLGFELIGLSAYSPDLNPIEGLWKWMREDVNQLQCHDTMRGLVHAQLDGQNADLRVVCVGGRRGDFALCRAAIPTRDWLDALDSCSAAADCFN